MDTSSSWTAHPRAVAPVAVSLTLEGLAILAVALRFYSHRLKRQGTAAHDLAILVALIFSSGLVACLIAATVIGGLGQHTADLPNPAVQLVQFAKIYLALSPIWGCAISAVKISILLLYISIFRSKVFIRCCYGLILLQSLWCVAVILGSLLLCRPLKMNWDATAEGHCGSTTAIYLALHIVNLLFDVSVGLAPIPVLWQLQLKLWRKIELSCMFALGIAICIITILRINMINDLVSTDLTYSSSTLFLFMILETLLGAILACLPMLRPAMQKFSTFYTLHSTFKGFKSSSPTGKSGRSYDTGHSSSGASSRTKKEFWRVNSSVDSTAKMHTRVTSEQHDLNELRQTQSGPIRDEEAAILVTNTWDVELARKLSGK